MHADLFAVRDLLEAETELEALRDEAAQLARRIHKGKRRIHDLEVQKNQEKAAVADKKKAELQVQRRLEEFRARLVRTQSLIDSGQGDYGAAVKQRDELNRVIDRTEGELLEAIDEREKAERAVVRTDELQAVARGRLKTAGEKQRDRRPAIEKRFAVLAPRRKALQAELSTDLANRYKDLRARKRPVLVRVVDGVCEHCNMSVPAHMAGEVASGRRIHTCRGCGCWLRDVVVTDPAVEEDED